MFASVATDISSFIAASGTFISGVALWQVRRIDREVKTFNDLTLGRASDATETRRIEDIEPADRTAKEWEHLAPE